MRRCARDMVTLRCAEHALRFPRAMEIDRGFGAMSIQAVLLPLFVEVILTFVLLYWMAHLRTSAFRKGDIKAQNIALREPNWPPHITQVSNAYHNQLELPVLFYVLTILAWITRHADLLFVVLAWIFVLSRLVHAYIHVTDNNVNRRGPAFGLGALVLTIMWLIFMIRILLGI
jgi:hypothetical protein